MDRHGTRWGHEHLFGVQCSLVIYRQRTQQWSTTDGVPQISQIVLKRVKVVRFEGRAGRVQTVEGGSNAICHQAPFFFFLAVAVHPTLRRPFTKPPIIAGDRAAVHVEKRQLSGSVAVPTTEPVLHGDRADAARTTEGIPFLCILYDVMMPALSCFS